MQHYRPLHTRGHNHLSGGRGAEGAREGYDIIYPGTESSRRREGGGLKERGRGGM